MPLHTLIDEMTSRSHAFLTFFFSLPFFLPIPLPGLSTLLGLVMAVAGIGMFLNKKPWLPKAILTKQVPTQILGKIFEKAEKMSKVLEKLIRPRSVFVLRYPWIRQLNGLAIAMCSLLLALPLPPGTNLPPAAAILLLSVGSLEEDIVFIGLGYLVFAANLLFFGGLFFFGIDGLQWIWNNMTLVF